MGTVWRAVDRRTGAAVAIKVIDKKKLNPALFNMEVFAMQRCSGHPHIVQLLAAFDDEDAFSLAACYVVVFDLGVATLLSAQGNASLQVFADDV